MYECTDCSGCEHKSRCLYPYNAQKNPDWKKVMKISEQREKLKEEFRQNIQNEKGIMNC